MKATEEAAGEKEKEKHMAGMAHLHSGSLFSISEIGCGQKEQRSAGALPTHAAA